MKKKIEKMPNIAKEIAIEKSNNGQFDRKDEEHIEVNIV